MSSDRPWPVGRARPGPGGPTVGTGGESPPSDAEADMLHRARDAFRAGLPSRRFGDRPPRPEGFSTEAPGVPPSEADATGLDAADAADRGLPVEEGMHEPRREDGTADHLDAGFEVEMLEILIPTLDAVDAPAGVFAWPGGAARWVNEALRSPEMGNGSDRTLMELLDEWSQAHFLVRALPDLLRVGLWRGRIGFAAAESISSAMSATVTAHRGLDGEIDALSLIAYPLAEADPGGGADGTEQLVAALVQHVSDLILVVEPSGAITFASPAAGDLLDVTDADPAGDIFDVLHPDDRPGSLRDLVRLSDEGVPVPARVRMRAAEGEWRHLDAVWTDLTDNPMVAGFVVNARDVTDDVEGGQAIVTKAFTDELTGLPNRVRLFDRMEVLAHSGPEPRPVALLLVNLDHFRKLHEQHGSADTDAALAAIAHRIVTAAPDDATVARLRADEFAVVLPDVAEGDEGVRIADGLRAAISEPLWMGEQTVRVTASVGVSLGQADEADEDLLARADHAMHRAKEYGRDRATVYDDEAAKRDRPRPGVDVQLRRALESDGLQIRYQPIVELDSRKIVGAEALLRVRGDQGELLSPAEFVEAAESSGLISRLGAAVLRTTCEQITALGRSGLSEGFEVSVNVSPRQVAHPQFASDVLEILADTDVAPPRLCLEITEGAFLGRDDASEGNILRLRDQGVRIGLDEFGGYTSLGYLRRFPLDFVKIDRSIVSGLGGNYVDGAIVRATVELGRKLDLTTVAVGVETEIQRQRLREIGCDRAQGYLFAPAVSADELPAL